MKEAHFYVVREKKNTLSIIGDNIRKIRLSHDMSQNQLAFEAGVSREFINKVESGKYNISVIKLEKIAQILEVEITVLFKS